MPYTDALRSKGAYIPPTVFAGATPDLPDRPRGDLRTGRRDRPVRHRGRGAGHRQRHDLRAVGGALHPRPRPRLARGPGLKAGQVYVNQWFSPGVLEAPSHGYKQSGYGGVGIEKYQQSKNVFFKVSDPGR